MIFAPYYYEESKTSNDKNYLYIYRVEEDDDTELFDPLNQFMLPFTLKLKDRSGYIQNAWNH